MLLTIPYRTHSQPNPIRSSNNHSTHAPTMSNNNPFAPIPPPQFNSDGVWDVGLGDPSSSSGSANAGGDFASGKPVFRTTQQRDKEAYALLDKIDQLAEAWCADLQQQQEYNRANNNINSNNNNNNNGMTEEQQRVVQFCVQTLQKIITKSKERKSKTGTSDATAAAAAETTANTNAMAMTSLPSWNYLPGAVLTLDYWSHQLARRCTYREAALYLASRLTATQPSEFAAERYVQVCEMQVKAALAPPPPAATAPPPLARHPNNNSNDDNDVFLTPQQALDPGSIFDTDQHHVNQHPAPAPAPAAAASKHQRVQQLFDEERVDTNSIIGNNNNTTPTNIMLDCNDNVAIVPRPSPVTTKKKPPPSHAAHAATTAPTQPASAKSITPESPSKAIQYVAAVATGTPNAPSLSAQELLASLFHASRCPHAPPPSSHSGEPCFFEHCAFYKKLWTHIVQSSSSRCGPELGCGGCTTYCNGARHCSALYCFPAKQALRHFRKCKSSQCGICGPVLRIIPKLKQDLEHVRQVQPQLRRQAKADGDQKVTKVMEQAVPPTAEHARGAILSNANNLADRGSATTTAAATTVARAQRHSPPLTPTGSSTTSNSSSGTLSPLPPLVAAPRSVLKRASSNNNNNSGNDGNNNGGKGPLKKRHRVKFQGAGGDSSSKSNDQSSATTAFL